MLRIYVFQIRLRIAVGLKIRKFRIQRNLSQEALAVKAGLPPNYLSLLERGGANVSVDSIEKLSKVLRVKPFELLKD